MRNAGAKLGLYVNNHFPKVKLLSLTLVVICACHRGPLISTALGLHLPPGAQLDNYWASSKHQSIDSADLHGGVVLLLGIPDDVVQLPQPNWSPIAPVWSPGVSQEARKDLASLHAPFPFGIDWERSNLLSIYQPFGQNFRLLIFSPQDKRLVAAMWGQHPWTQEAKKMAEQMAKNRNLKTAELRRRYGYSP